MEYVNELVNGQFHNTVIALGKFDGLHLGHQTLLAKLEEYKREGYNSCVFTFDMGIAKVSRNAKEKHFLLSSKERQYLLAKWGVDILCEIPFTQEFRCMHAKAFIEEYLIKKMGAKVIVVGEDYHFGKNREGDVSLLEKLSHRQYQLEIVPKLSVDQEVVSATKIRKLVALGKMEDANELLGYPYFIKGEVIHGRQMGRKMLELPTANLAVEDSKLVPPNGVYVARVHLKDSVYYGITNIGVKPTIEGENAMGVETNIFDFDEDIYGEEMIVELLNYERPEMQFDSLEQLKSRMHKDVTYGKMFLNGRQ